MKLKYYCRPFLEVGLIFPGTIPYSSPMVMVLKKHGGWCTCPNLCSLYMFTIKYEFPILVIDDILDELHCARFLTKLDIYLGYHQVRMKEANIPKLTFCICEGHCEFIVMPFEIRMPIHLL